MYGINDVLYMDGGLSGAPPQKDGLGPKGTISDVNIQPRGDMSHARPSMRERVVHHGP
jgi:hypothetical protein